MTAALWCVFIAALLPYPFAAAAKWSRRFDNAKPRDYLEQTQGWRKRAHWTQLNSFEVFPAFAAAVIIAHLLKGPSAAANLLAEAFVILRILYGICYLADKATLRSITWVAAQLCTIGLFIVAVK
jgi:uncharacterized MAPEG superfamily protein